MMDTASANDHIRSYLNYYTQLEVSPGFAVMITGAWGVGKSWLLRDYVRSTGADQFLWVSIYGAGSADEIAERIFAAKWPLLHTKGAVIAGRVVKGLLKVGLQIELDGETQLTAGGDLSQALNKDGKTKTPSLGGRTLVLDDIERSSVEGKQLWGFINHLVEHEGVKVILLSHEGEISDTAYRVIKEKNIGITLAVTPDASAALDNFITEHPSAASPLQEHGQLILRTFEASGCGSLRVLRFAVCDFSRVFAAMSSALRGRPEVVADILATTIALSIEFHRGTLSASMIQRLSRVYILSLPNELTPEDSLLKAIIEQYSEIVSLSSVCPSHSWWETFFARGEVDSVSLIKDLEERHTSKPRPPWLRLWDHANLTDAEFHSLMEETWNELVGHKYRVVGPLLHVAALHLWAISIKLSERSAESILAEANAALEDLTEEELLEGQIAIDGSCYPDFESAEGYFGLMYISNQADFATIREHAETLTMEAVAARTRLQHIRLGGVLRQGGAAFAQALDAYGHRGDVLSGIKVTEFVEVLLALPPPDQRRVISSLKRHVSEAERPRELEWLQQVTTIISQPTSPPSLQRYIVGGRLGAILRNAAR